MKNGCKVFLIKIQKLILFGMYLILIINRVDPIEKHQICLYSVFVCANPFTALVTRQNSELLTASALGAELLTASALDVANVQIDYGCFTPIDCCFTPVGCCYFTLADYCCFTPIAYCCLTPDDQLIVAASHCQVQKTQQPHDSSFTVTLNNCCF